MLNWLLKKKKRTPSQETSQESQKSQEKITTRICTFNTQSSSFEKIIYELQEAGSFKNILCIPSYQGELVYSLALALVEAGVSSHLFHIVGINSDKKVVEKAGYGTYIKDAIANTSNTIVQKYFEPIGERFKISKSIKGSTSFQNIDIEHYDIEKLGKFDYIITNNSIDREILKQICRDKKNILLVLEEEFIKE